MQTIQKPLGPPDLIEEEGLTTVLGPCPGCDNWQLDYTQRAATSYAGWVIGVEQMPRVDLTPFYAVIEQALQEHMAECPHLRDLVQEYE